MLLGRAGRRVGRRRLSEGLGRVLLKELGQVVGAVDPREDDGVEERAYHVRGAHRRAEGHDAGLLRRCLVFWLGGPVVGGGGVCMRSVSGLVVVVVLSICMYMIYMYACMHVFPVFYLEEERADGLADAGAQHVDGGLALGLGLLVQGDVGHLSRGVEQRVLGGLRFVWFWGLGF